MSRHGPDTVSFEDMLEDARGRGQPAVILGNGFSRAWSDECFDYRSLFEDTNLSTRAQAVFHLFQTTDFEAAMRTLVLLRELLGHYDETDGLREELDKDITELREALLQAISEHHPSEAGEVTLKEYRACASFLRRFCKIFTVNYDLLLYWVINHMVKDRTHPCTFDDGFRKPWPQEHLFWDPDKSMSQNVFYLHGGLHIMRRSPYPRKLMWGEDSIMTQLRRILGAGKVPLFVAEGLGSQKMANILTNPYLHACYTALQENDNPLVFFGMALSDADDHITEAVVKSKVEHCYMGFRSTSKHSRRATIIERCEAMEQARKKRRVVDKTVPPLTFKYYWTDDARVWGE